MTVNGSHKNVTISDVARAAGVSKTTVSRYINGKYSLMSPETRERIAAVIEMSHYRPSSIAQSLKAKQSYQIGVVVADVSAMCSWRTTTWPSSLTAKTPWSWSNG